MARYVSLIPFVSDSVVFPGLCDIWSTCDVSTLKISKIWTPILIKLKLEIGIPIFVNIGHRYKHILTQKRNICFCLTMQLSSKWAASWQNQQNDCVPWEDSDQPGHPPSLIRVFAVHSMGSWGPKLSSCGQRRLWSDWASPQSDLSLRWVHSHFVGFLKCKCP